MSAQSGTRIFNPSDGDIGGNTSSCCTRDANFVFFSTAFKRSSSFSSLVTNCSHALDVMISQKLFEQLKPEHREMIFAVQRSLPLSVHHQFFIIQINWLRQFSSPGETPYTHPSRSVTWNRTFNTVLVVVVLVGLVATAKKQTPAAKNKKTHTSNKNDRNTPQTNHQA